jgi:phenylacetate-CoA ligase
LKSKINALLNNSISVNIYNTSDETNKNVINLLDNHQFSHIRSYPQFLYSVAEKMEDIGKAYNIKSISTTAEPIMSNQRDLFRKVFNAEVYDQFGCGEIGGIAYECNHHEGMHIAEERVILELNDRNEIIVTDLDNFTMPFIRYWNADQAVIAHENCSCGRKSRLIKYIMGRTCDYVTGLNNEFLHWAYFWHLIFDSNIAKNRNLKKFQVVQESKDEIIIRLVSDPLSPIETEFFISDIQKRLGLMKVTFSYDHDIENTKTGKYRPVINKLI